MSPNWCRNDIEINGPDEDIIDFLDKSRVTTDGEERIFSFQGLVPRPKELDITSGGYVDNAMAIILAEEHGDWKEINKIFEYTWVKNDKKIRSKEDLLKVLKHRCTVDGFREGRQALDNLKKYGYKDWYGWNNGNWGTKWDTSDVEVEKVTEGNAHISFNTAWGPPTEYIQSASKLYPNIRFETIWSEEGGYEGDFIIKNGIVTEQDSRETEYYDIADENGESYDDYIAPLEDALTIARGLVNRGDYTYLAVKEGDEIIKEYGKKKEGVDSTFEF